MSTPPDPSPRNGNAYHEEEEKGFHLDPQRLWQLIRRRSFFLILPLIVIGLVVGVGVQSISPVFISSSKILLEERGTGTDLDRLIVTPQMQRMRDQNRLTVVREKLRSEELLLKVIRSLRLRENPAILDQALILQQTQLPEETVTIIAERILVTRLRQKVWVQNDGSDLFLINVKDNDPLTSFRLNEALVQAFIDQDTKERYERILETSNFTDEQMEQARADLQAAESELEIFKRGMLVRDELSGNPVNSGNVQSAATLMRTAALDRDEAVRELEQVRQRLSGRGVSLNAAPSVVNDTEVQNLVARLSSQYRDDYISELSRRSNTSTTGNSSSGISLERQRIGAQRNRLAERIRTLVAGIWAGQSVSVQNDLALLHEYQLVGDLLTRHESQISREYRSFVRNVQAQPGQEAELNRLEAAVDRADQFFQTLMNARLAGDTTMLAEQSGFGSRIRVIDPPKKPLSPSEPNKVKIALLAAFLAFGIGIAAIFLAEYVDTSFKDIDSLREATGLEVLGTLPRFSGVMHWEEAKRRRTLAWRSAFSVALILIMTLFVFYYRNSMEQDRVYLVDPTNSVSSTPGEN